MADLSDLSMDIECLFSGLPQATCSHCRGDVEDVPLIDDSEDWEITRTFEAQFSDTCVIDRRHKVKKGSKVGFVRHADNPFIPVSGVACASCVLSTPSARGQ